MKRYGIRVALALTLAVPACGGSASTGSGADGPGGNATPSASPSPTPTLPPVAADKKLVKQALVTPADLGKPWVEPKKVNQAKAAKGELCPGHKNSAARNKPRADQRRQMTKGSKPGAAIVSVAVRTYALGTEAAWRDAFAAAAKGCKSWTAAEKTFVTLEVVTPPTVAGADEVLAHVERIYADKTKKTLYYVRHWVEARTGRVVTAFEHAFVQPKSDPTGADLTATVALVETQVAKVRTTFGL
ncbi:MAG TPA: hypothetical protein VNA20_02290 [Frankiaceae bacterium]|nr:hypothetical protein [Frankiaceae bacterium]